MPNRDNLTTIDSHSGESKCETVVNEYVASHSEGTTNSYLGKRYHLSRSTSGFHFPAGISKEYVVDRFKQSFSETDFGCDNMVPDPATGELVENSTEVENLGPNLASDLKYGSEDSDNVHNNLGPNLLPPDVSSSRGAFTAEADNSIAALPADRESAYFADDDNNPIKTTESHRRSTKALLDQRKA